jgi:hypothetical protein
MFIINNININNYDYDYIIKIKSGADPLEQII